MTKSEPKEMLASIDLSRRDLVRRIALGSGAALLLPWGQAFAQRPESRPRPQGRPGGPSPRDPETLVDEAAEPADDFSRLASVNPKLYAALNDSLHRLKYKFALAAVGKAPANDAFGRAANAYIASRKPERRQSYRTVATGMLSAPAQRQSNFGRYAAVAPDDAARLSPNELTQRAGGLLVKPGELTLATIQQAQQSIWGSQAAQDALKEMLEQAAAEKAAKEAAAAKDLADGKKYTKLEVYLRRVECIERSEVSDEIELGGYIVGATGNRAKIDKWYVGEYFIPAKEGGKTNYGPNNDDYLSAIDYVNRNGKHLGWFNINQDEPWGHDYTVGLAMSEYDYGGFGDFLAALWDEIGGMVSTSVGGAVQGLVPIPGLGYAIGWLIGEFVGWLVSGFADDLVGGIQSHTTFYGMTKKVYTKSFPNSQYGARKGSYVSKWGVTYTRDITGGGHGRYRVKLGWRVFDAAGYKIRNDERLKHLKNYGF
jgi:hypothetical protein